MHTKSLIISALGGAIGVFLRAAIGQFVPFQVSQFAWGTFFINMLGCILIGFCLHAIANPTMRAFVVVGILGGFTTFSGFGLEMYQYFSHSKFHLAVIYGLSSLIFGTVLVYLGIKCYQILFV